MMRLIDQAILRELRGKPILLVFNNKGTRALEVNESFAFLWGKFQGRDFSLQEIARALVEEYDIAPETAENDALGVISIWKEKDLLIEQ